VAPTLDELAALSGVSRATVSRVINGGSVSRATRERVLAVVERSGYRPNIAARMLASGRSNVVAIAMHVDPHLLFHDPYFSQLMQGMSDVLADREAGLMLWLGNRTKEETLEHILGFALVDGVIATAHEQDDPLVDGLLTSRLPVVLIGHRRAERNASYVDVDHVAAADAITTHLAQLGRRRIAHITGSHGTVAAEDRLAGYLRAMGRARLPVADMIATGDFNEISGEAAVGPLLDAGADAIFCANDASALGALTEIHRRGLRVPEDVALAGFDDLDFAAHTDPPLTTVRQGVRAQGAEAVRALFQLIADPDGGPRRVILPTELVIRASTVGGVPATR
jgi:DNA-binding LacI/PurR family transcriptional regulator